MLRINRSVDARTDRSASDRWPLSRFATARQAGKSRENETPPHRKGNPMNAKLPRTRLVLGMTAGLATVALATGV
ncbi:hypothetical protein ABT256_28335, partial [Amycolatopsis japonica]